MGNQSTVLGLAGPTGPYHMAGLIIKAEKTPVGTF